LKHIQFEGLTYWHCDIVGISGHRCYLTFHSFFKLPQILSYQNGVG